MSEIRPHPHLPGISAGSDGTIYRNGRAVNVRPLPSGYTLITIREAGRRTAIGAHVIVCETFHGPRPSGKQAAHRNGQRSDNRSVNLRWATRRENEADKRRHGTHPLGSASGRALLTEEQVTEIRRIAATGRHGIQRRLALRFGVSNMTISNIVLGKSWTHVEQG